MNDSKWVVKIVSTKQDTHYFAPKRQIMRKVSADWFAQCPDLSRETGAIEYEDEVDVAATKDACPIVSRYWLDYQECLCVK
jgi:hypothetical protein